jgi:hypothetical protein
MVISPEKKESGVKPAAVQRIWFTHLQDQ